MKNSISLGLRTAVFALTATMFVFSCKKKDDVEPETPIIAHVPGTPWTHYDLANAIRTAESKGCAIEISEVGSAFVVSKFKYSANSMHTDNNKKGYSSGFVVDDSGGRVAFAIYDSANVIIEGAPFKVGKETFIAGKKGSTMAFLIGAVMAYPKIVYEKDAPAALTGGWRGISVGYGACYFPQ